VELHTSSKEFFVHCAELEEKCSWGRVKCSVALHLFKMSAEQQGASKESVISTLNKHLQPTDLVVHDVSGGCGAKYELYINSNKFDGVALLARHRLVQEAMKAEGLMDKIHALTIKAWTAAEWEKKKDTIPKEE
jgi:stress-induced morphogen